jgi:hypothetical protein
VELKRRQPNKRKRLTRDDDSINNIQDGRNSDGMNDVDRLMHLWTTNDCKDCYDMTST